MTSSTATLAPGTLSVPGAGADAEPPPLPGELAAARALIGSVFGDHDGLAVTVDVAVPGPSATASAAVARAAGADYPAWLAHVRPAAACSHPVRLRGQLYRADPATGELHPTRHTDDLPDAALYKACGNRRAVVCPGCAETYRADTYHLILAGLRGGHGVPTTVATHPAAFATLTAPSFGLVHSTRAKNGRPRMCRPRRTPTVCPHGVELACPRVHRPGERILGTPLCEDCYDHDHQVVWNAFAGELWRRTVQTARTHLDTAARELGAGVRLSYAKAAEMQARGVAHFHALLRLDGDDPSEPAAVTAAPAGLGYPDLRAALTAAARATRFRTPPHPDRPDGWLIEWGPQLDTRQVHVTAHGEVTEGAVAAYLAKYATKATESTGHVSARLTLATVAVYADPDGSHPERLVEACWRLGRPGADLDPAQAVVNSGRLSYLRLRRWAHMLGFGGHFSTKSRRYSTTLTERRKARQTWARSRHHTVEHLDETTEDTTLVVGALTYAGIGWHTTGDALLANTAAARAREHNRVVRDELGHYFGTLRTTV